jgi:hypothetical protein
MKSFFKYAFFAPDPFKISVFFLTVTGNLLFPDGESCKTEFYTGAGVFDFVSFQLELCGE